MPKHKYQLGQLVRYFPSKLQEASTSGDYKITRLLPYEGGELQYRVKHASEVFERVAGERQLESRKLA